MLRESKQQGAGSLFIFGDDVVLGPHIYSALSSIEQPQEWRVFYFGGTHFEHPEVVTPELAGASRMMSVRALNKREDCDDHIPGADVVLARLHSEIHTYAVSPNLGGQRPEVSLSEIVGTIHIPVPTRHSFPK